MRCDRSLLWTLVEQDREPDDAMDSIARHIESCPRCRQELAELGGDASWWREASEYLPNAEKPTVGREATDDNAPLPIVDLSFLDPPSHPETLGRIGRYEVEGLLGRGGMGVVLRGYDADLHRTVAIKVLAPEWAASVQARRRFAREAQAAASVAHENVVPIFNVEAEAPLPYLVMAYVPGMTLERWIKTYGAPDTATVLRVAGQLADGLAAAHRRGLVHRDIKPGNILVGENIDRVWITDFGLARAADSVTLTRTGVIAGTPHFMSPEQARGEAIDHRSDLFSLGCVLYFLASGSPPFDADNTLAVLHKIVSSKPESLAVRRNDLPPSYVALVHRLLERRVDRRPQDCEAVIEMLKAGGEELEKGRVASVPRSSVRLAAGMTVILIACMTSAWLWMRKPNEIHPLRISETPTLFAADAASDPWQANSDVEAVANPYVSRATDAIDSALTTDMEGLKKQIAILQRRANDMSTTGDSLVAPSLSLGDERWKEQTSHVETQLDRFRTLQQN